MTTDSSIPAWRIPWTEKPGVLLSKGLQRVRHDRGTELKSHQTHTGCACSWDAFSISVLEGHTCA